MAFIPAVFFAEPFRRSQRKIFTLRRDSLLTFAAPNVEKEFFDLGRNGSARRAVQLDEDAACQRIGAVADGAFVALDECPGLMEIASGLTSGLPSACVSPAQAIP